MFDGEVFQQVFGDLWKFSTDTATWETLTPSTVIPSTGQTPGVRFCHAMAIVGTNIFIHGGFDSPSFIGKADFWQFDTETATLEQLTTPQGVVAPEGRGHHVMTAVGGDLWMHGGRGVNGYLDDLWRYSTAEASWEQLMSPKGRAKPSARMMHGIAVVGNGFFIHGGQLMTPSCISSPDPYCGGE